MLVPSRFSIKNAPATNKATKIDRRAANDIWRFYDQRFADSSAQFPVLSRWGSDRAVRLPQLLLPIGKRTVVFCFSYGHERGPETVYNRRRASDHAEPS